MKHMYSVAILCIALLAGCSTSKMTSSWKAKDYPTNDLKRILVLGLINEPDRSIRESMEANIVSNLKALGYDATCACEEFGPKAFENLNEREAIAKLGTSDIDAVLTIVLIDKKTENYYLPDKMNYSPYAYNSRFWEYYMTMHDRLYIQKRLVTGTRYFWESNLYTLGKSPGLLYSGQSQSFDPASTSRLAYEYGQMIVKAMLKSGVITKKQQEKTPLAF